MSAVAEMPKREVDESPPTSSAERSASSAKRLRLAYLVNQYPQPSHSFIRREVQALEALGYDVARFTVRRWNGTLIDEGDVEERAKTTAILEQGIAALIYATVCAAFASPRRFMTALAQAWRWGRRSDRGRLLNLVYLAEAAALRRMLLARRINHVHAHFGTNSTSVAMLCRLLGGPSFSFTVHGPEEFDKPEFLHLGDKIRAASFVVAISQFGRSQLFRQCAYEDWRKIEIVRCGVDAAFHDAPSAAIPSPPRLVCIARLHEQKGLPVLVDALAELAERGVPCHVTVIGDGPLRPALQARIDELGLRQSIELAGWKSSGDVRAALLNSRGLVLPSFAEGLPVVIMEALALRRPVISTYVAGIPELVADQVCGRLVAAGDVAALADAMQSVVEASPELLERWGHEGARRVQSRHCARDEAGRLAQLFESRSGD